MPKLTPRNADRHKLYEQSVQQPVVMAGFIQELFAQFVGRPPITLREDFCGTAQLAATWVASDCDRRAIGVDIDGDVLAWADTNNRAPLEGDAKRLALVESDVLKCRRTADALASLNFSHFIYKRRDQLVRYLKHAARCIKPGGLFICDTYGGPGAFEPCRDERKFNAFTYVWEQESYDALTNRVVNHIHFKFPGGGTLRNAFTYDWRLWSIAELREAIAEAGLEEVGVCFESEDGFVDDLDTHEHQAWVAYLVAQKV